MNLPPEILSLICGLMSKKTLKCARMACKALEQATIPFLFDEVFMSSTYFDIEVANNVTTHFAQHIKTITLSFRYFPEYTKIFFTDIPQCQESGWSRDCIEDHETFAFDTYYKRRAEHMELLGSGELLAQLRQVVMRLPALRKLALTDRGCGREPHPSELYSHDLWKRGYLCLLESCTLSKADHACFHIGPRSGHGNDDPNPWRLIMLALSVADLPITEIVSTSRCRTCLIPIGSFLMTLRQAQDVTMRFNVLTKLRLSLRDDDAYENEEHQSYIDDSSVPRALSAAVNLKSLFIETDGEIHYESCMWTVWSILLEGCRFPELRSLILLNIDAEEEELMKLLGASPRLENLLLCHFRLSAGLWASVAARMKSILQLKRVELTDLTDGFLPSLLPEDEFLVNNDHRLVEDFFLREGENPFTEQAVKQFYDNNDEERRWEINRRIGSFEEYIEAYH